VILFISLIVCIVGLWIYRRSVDPKWSQVGFGMFCCGMLAFLLTIGPAWMALQTRFPVLR